MGYSYKGSLSFGLIYIPIQLTNAIRNNDISFNMLEKNTLSRVQYKKTCVDCNNKEIDTSNIVKGYQYEEGKYIIFDESDFEKLKTKKDKNITIESFVNLNEIDPLYYDKAYYVVPTGGYKAFTLLKKAMEDENKVGIAKAILGNKETLIVIRVKNNQMFLNTMYFHEEVLKNPFEEVNTEVSPEELKLAKAIINNMTTTFIPESYHDDYRERVIKAIEMKIKGQELLPLAEQEDNPVSSLMDALQKSLKSTTNKKLKASTDVIDIEGTVKKLKPKRL
jgi:DNA end-binding protein Ku